MKRIAVCVFIVIFALVAAINVSAQSAETIWLTVSTTAYKTGETVIVNLNAASATPIQGFTFQIRYDPACLKPVNASSTLPGMNALPLPQISGLVDGSYASVSPQTVNGVLAEVHLVTLKDCQTNLTLESAALAIRTSEGFAAPLAGIAIDSKTIGLNINKEVAASQPAQQVSGSVLPLEPPVAKNGLSDWWLLLLVPLFAGALFVAYALFQNRKRLVPGKPAPSRSIVALHIKHGPHAGESFVLNKLPCQIGRDAQNDICINDPHIVGQHAKIVSTNRGYYLMRIDGETFLNGRAVGRSSAALKPGDVVRLGKSALFVFG